jgi:hypothetical protein
MEQPANANLFDLQLDQNSINYLNEAARWSRFLSILGFIYCGLLVIAGLFLGSVMSRMMSGINNSDAAVPAMMGGGFFGFFFICGSLIIFFPSLFLFNFSSKLRKAFRGNDQPVLAESFRNLKSFFKFYGIVAIIGLSIYALAIVAAIIGAMVASRH